MTWFWTAYLLTSIPTITTFGINIQKKDNIAECLSVLIHNEDVPFTINVRLKIKAENKTIERNFENTVNRFLAASKSEFLVSLSLRASSSYNIYICLYFVDSVKSFQYLLEKQRAFEHNISGRNKFFLIVLPTDDSGQNNMVIMQRMIDFCSGTFLINMNVVIEDSASGIVTLYTFFPFNENNCRDTSPMVRNRFINGSFESKELSFPRKTKNFHQCPLRVVLWREFPYMMINDNKFSGIDGNTLNYLADLMNFTIEVIVPAQGRGRIYSRKNMTGSFKLINERFGDLVIGGIVSEKTRMELFTYTMEYHSTFLLIVVKKPSPYSSLEILLFPFDRLTWFLILLTLLLKKLCKKISKKLTIIGMVTRSSKYLVPFRLIVWFFSFLILRSSYEGSIFKFLHSQPEKALPLNLNEAIDEGFTFLCETSFKIFVDEIPELAKRILVFEAPLFEIFDIFDRYHGKFALITKETYLSFFNNNSSRYKEYYILKHPYRVMYFCIYMPKFSFLQDELNKRLAQIVEHGHIKQFQGSYVSTQNFRNKMDDREPMNLSISQLLGAFQLFAVMNVVSICIFVMELLSRQSRVLRKIIELLD